MGVRAIPTTYKGVTFASKLEANWCKTLDSWNVVWTFEPEGVYLPNGRGYLSDLYLPRLKTWVEVKGPHDARIDKPAKLSTMVRHAPGCSSGRSDAILDRPPTVAPASCPCGYGPDFPYMLVVVARPATAGKASFEPVHGASDSTRIVVMDCTVCGQRSFTDLGGIPLCRRCRQDASGSTCHATGRLPFLTVNVPRGAKTRARR